MPRGGKRKGAGRKPDLPLHLQEEIARKYRDRMWAWAAATAIGRDPNMQERWQIEQRMRQLASRIEEPADDRSATVKYHPQFQPEMEKLQKRLVDLPNQLTVSWKRAKGRAGRVVRELAEEYRVSQRMVVRCINKV